MDRLVDVKFHTNIANRWLFMIQRKIMAIVLHSQSYLDMFRGGSFFSGHGVVVVFNSNLPLEEGNIRMEYPDCRYTSFSKTFILVTYQWHQLGSSGVFKSLA